MSLPGVYAKSPLFLSRLIAWFSGMEAAHDADAVVIVTEWQDFRAPDFDALKAAMKSPVIFDGRNQYDPERLRADGFSYYSIGRL